MITDSDNFYRKAIMIFRLLLLFFGLGVKGVLLIVGLRSPAFKQSLGERRFTMQVRTLKNGLIKTFVFADGKMSFQKISDEPDFLIEWADSSTALGVLIKPISLLMFKPEEIVIAGCDALMAGKLKIEYNVGACFWMAMTIKDLPLALLKGNNYKE